MAGNRIRKFHLIEGEYTEDFIKYLAMAIHLELIEPSELTVMLEDGTNIKSITNLLAKRILDSRG